MSSLMTRARVAHAVQTERVFRWWDYPLFVLLTGLNLAAVFYFAAYWVSLRGWAVYPLEFSVLALVAAVVLGNIEFRWFLLWFMRRPKPATAAPGWNVAVATTFVPGSDSLEMLEKTVKALVAISYPHDTWVLDEGDEESVKRICLKVGARHFTRKNLSAYQTQDGSFKRDSKHGNYNAWFDQIAFERYDIITIFDPDHVPKPAFLAEVLGYFQDPSVAYVQTPQAYYNQKASFIARGAAEETYAFYSSVQMASYGLGYPVLIGCHNTHRVSALKEIGGFPCHDAEDLLMTLLYRSRGWQGVYVPQVLARGLAPVDWDAYLNQQRRWARSVLDIKLRIYAHLSARFPFKTRIMSLLHGFNYLHKSFIMLGFIGLLVGMLATGVVPRLVAPATPSRMAGLVGVLLLCELYRQRFYLAPRTEAGLHWRAAVLQFAKWPYFVMAFWDVVRRRRFSYVVTRKVKARREKRLFLWPHAVALVVVTASWIFGTVSGAATSAFLNYSAAGFAAACLTLLLTEYLSFPDPYDSELAADVRADSGPGEGEEVLSASSLEKSCHD